MKTIRKIALVLLMILSMIKPSFIIADEDTKPIDVNVTVSVSGTDATVEMVPWDKQLKNKYYIPGPPLANPTLNIAAGSSKDFVVNIKESGNYVYEIKQINKTDSTIDYDSDIQGEDKIYRFYISVIYKEGSNNKELIYFVEAESCDDYSCIISPVSDDDIPVPHDNAHKPSQVCFENKPIPDPEPGPTPTPDIPKTGITVQDIIITGGLCSELLILLLMIFKRKKKTEN